MLEIPMSQNIKDFETRSIGPLTLRQAICIAISCSYGIPLAIHLPGDISLRILIVLLLMAPVIACGWLKIQGKYFEKFIFMVIRNTIIRSKKRYPEKNTLYECLPPKQKPIHKETKTSKKIKGYK